MKIKQKKQIEALKSVKSEANKQDMKLIKGIFRNDMRTNEIKNKID